MAQGRKTGGRKKGTPNRLTATIKGAIEEAFEEVGGASYLAQMARQEPVAFMSLLGKVLPTQVTGEDGGAIVHQIELVALESANSASA